VLNPSVFPLVRIVEKNLILVHVRKNYVRKELFFLKSEFPSNSYSDFKEDSQNLSFRPIHVLLSLSSLTNQKGSSFLVNSWGRFRTPYQDFCSKTNDSYIFFLSVWILCAAAFQAGVPVWIFDRA
jgi:hypothetical protein